MEKIPDNSNLERKFSKDHAQELRDETAQEIKRIRNLPISSKEAPEEITSAYYVQETQRELQANMFWRIFERSYYKDLEQIFQDKAKIRKIELVGQVQEDFKLKLQQILAECPLSPEEQEKYLSEEAMSEMDLDNYLVLLQRLSGNYVAHVTRQGVREKNFGMTSYAHIGETEFHNNFVETLREGQLHSFLTNILSDDPNLGAFLMADVKEIKVEKPDADVDEIFNILWARLNASETAEHDRWRGAHDHFPAELSSVHFSVNSVESELYGSEKGYDIYFYYPAEFIAHNYYHQTKGVYTPAEELQTRQKGVESDVFVWNEGKGVPVQASLVCIPENVQVDRKTGSQYALDSGSKPVFQDGQLVKAQDTINSKKYWETYFREHPELRPNKIIYYYRPFETFIRPIQNTNLITTKAFKRTDQLPEYEQHIAIIQEKLKDKLREIFLKDDGTESGK